MRQTQAAFSPLISVLWPRVCICHRTLWLVGGERGGRYIVDPHAAGGCHGQHTAGSFRDCDRSTERRGSEGCDASCTGVTGGSTCGLPR